MIELICTILLSIVALIAGWGQCVKDNKPTALGVVIFSTVLLLTTLGASSGYLSQTAEARSQASLQAQISLLQKQTKEDYALHREILLVEERGERLKASIDAYFFFSLNVTRDNDPRAYKRKIRVDYEKLASMIPTNLDPGASTLTAADRTYLFVGLLDVIIGDLIDLDNSAVSNSPDSISRAYEYAIAKAHKRVDETVSIINRDLTMRRLSSITAYNLPVQ